MKPTTSTPKDEGAIRMKSSVMRASVETAERLPWLKWVDRLSIAAAVLGGLATIGLMLNVVLDVIGRYFFRSPLPGTLDLTQFAWMPVLVSLGLGYALLHGEHIRVSLLTIMTGPRTQRVIEIVCMAWLLVITAMLLWFGAEKAAETMGFAETAVGTQWLMIWPFRWVIVFGLGVLLLQTVAALLRAIMDKNFQPIDEELAALTTEETDLAELPDESDATRKVATR